MSEYPITDRLLAGLRSNLESIANSAELSRVFKGNEHGYQIWLRRHAKNGYVLHRDTAAARIAYLHLASCAQIGGEEGVTYTKSPKIGSPTKEAALALALQKKWKVLTDCDQCSP